MSVRTLQVLINGALVGTLRDADNIWAFQYAGAWLASPGAFPLAPSLPLSTDWQVDGSSSRPVQWFFDNLLPEELMRQVLAKEVNVESADAFGMLERMGMESAGALVLQAEGAPQPEKGMQPLTWEDLSQRIRNLPRASLNKDAPKRMSLAGAQHKMVVLFDPKSQELSEPLKGTPSTHILKPNSTAEGYPHSVINETFTMLLAAEALVGAVALLLAEGFPRQLIAIFGAANESSHYADFAVKAFRTYLCMMVLACINKACFIFLQAIGKALASTLLSMFREVVFGVGFALLLPVFFGLDGVLYSMPVSDVLTFVISAFIIAKTYKELNTEGVDRV